MMHYKILLTLMLFGVCTLHIGHCSMGALGDSFFEYLIKSWVGTSEKDVEAKDMYFTTMKVTMYPLGRLIGIHHIIIFAPI